MGVLVYLYSYVSSEQSPRQLHIMDRIDLSAPIELVDKDVTSEHNLQGHVHVFNIELVR